MKLSLFRPLLAALCLAAATLSSVRAAEVEWRLAHYLQEEHFFADGWLQEWVAELERRSGGRIKVTIHPNNTLLRLGAIAPGVRAGDAEVGFGPAPSSHYLDLLELPFMVESANHGTRTAMALLEQGLLREDLAGLHTVLLQTNAPSLVHMKSKPVRVPADLEAQRMRGATDYIRGLLAALGAEPVAGFLAPQVFGAMESGAVDGTIWPYEAIRIFDLGKQARFHTEVPIFVSVLGLFVNQAAFDALAPDLKLIVEEMSGIAQAMASAGSWQAEEDRGKARVVELGNSVIVPTESEVTIWRNAARPLVEQRLAQLAAGGFDAIGAHERVRELTARLSDEPSQGPPTVLITGANRGLGLAWAEKYAARGWNVVTTARRPDAARALRSLAAAYPRVEVLPLDVTVIESIEALAGAIGDRPIDVIVNNAGMIGEEAGQRFRDLDPEQFDTFMRVNAMGPLLVTQRLLPNLLAGEQKKVAALSGRVSSFDVYPRIHPGLYYYKASKTALNMFVRNMAMDLKGEGVSAIVLSPGVVNTYGVPMSPSMPGLVDIDTSVDGMIEVLDRLDVEGSGRWYRYDGAIIPW